MRAQKHRDFGLRRPARSDVFDEPGQLVVGRANTTAVQPEKCQAAGQANTCVSVHEGMVLREMEEGGSRLLRDRRM